jgi:zinc protease
MRYVLIVVLLLFISCAKESMKKTEKEMKYKLVEKVEKKSDEIVIPYEKYKFDNGLTVILHEDKSDPIVHVDVTYHVGSAREEIGRSGFAHFFEHMMFQGSDNVADEEHFKIISEAGGTLNGTTNSDRTNYFETIPSNQLEKILWLEADRMGFLLDAVTLDKFENQRETVKNERGQRVDNVPYGRRFETISKNLYPSNHGYSWPVIGWMKDLNAATLDDLKKFFLRWYGPNNATLTIGGDFDKEETLALIQNYFGSIPSGPEVKMPEKPPVSIEADRYVSFEDNVTYPLIEMVFPTVPVRDPDEAPLDLLSNILGGGKNSIFYQNLVKTQYALNASVFHPCSELGGKFHLFALPNPRSGKTLADLEKLMREAIEEFEERGVNEDDLLKAKVQHETNTINGLASVSGKVSSLASYETFTENPNYIKDDLKRYNSVTKEDVMRVYRKYIKGKPAVILSVYQKGKPEQVAAPDNYSADEPENIRKEDYSDLKYVKASDNFDRSVMPKSGKNPVIKVPDFWTENFSNGLKLIGTLNNEIPTVYMEISIRGGHHAESLEKSGLASLTATMMNETTKNYSNEDMNNELQKTGSQISFSAGNNYTTISVRSLTNKIDRTLELLQEKLFNPAFSEEDFVRVQNQSIQALKQEKKNASITASNVFNRLLYGDQHIMSKPANGTEETISSITLEDVKEFYNSYYSPTISNLVIVGSLEKDEIISKLDFLKNWNKKEVKLAKQPVEKTNDAGKIFFVNKEKAAQSEIRIGYISMKYDATGEYYRSTLMNYALGGAFNSRINLNLREAKGYTYGARSYFSGWLEKGPYQARAGVRTNVTDSSVIEFMKELKGYREGISDDELMFMKNSIGQSDARKYETDGQKASFLRQIIEFDLDKNFVKRQNQILKNITKEDIDALIRKHIDLNKMKILVVGDKEEVYEKLRQLGYGDPIELDPDGNSIQQNL